MVKQYIYLEFTYKVETDWLSPPVSIHSILMWNLDKNKTVIGKNLLFNGVVLGDILMIRINLQNLNAGSLLIIQYPMIMLYLNY